MKTYECRLYYNSYHETRIHWPILIQWGQDRGLTFRNTKASYKLDKNEFTTFTYSCCRDVVFADEKIYTMFLLTFSKYLNKPDL